jgi:hypothetical protein
MADQPTQKSMPHIQKWSNKKVWPINWSWRLQFLSLRNWIHQWKMDVHSHLCYSHMNFQEWCNVSCCSWRWYQRNHY